MRFPQATWRGPVPNESPGRMGTIRGLVLHIESGSEAGTDNWFHNPGAQASAHFGNPKTGPLDQWVDTADKAWAEVNGNSNWVSVEHEGQSGDQLTPSQLDNDARLLAWLNTNYGVPLVATDDPNGSGLGWHGMGGDAWGGHYACPGDPIVAQRPAIIQRASLLLIGSPPTPAPPAPTTEEEDPMLYLLNFDDRPGTYITDGDRAWGVPSQAWLDVFFFGTEPGKSAGIGDAGPLAERHLGTVPGALFWTFRDRDGSVRTPPPVGPPAG